MPGRAVQSRAVKGKIAGEVHMARCAVAFAETAAARAADAEESCPVLLRLLGRMLLWLMLSRRRRV